MKKENIYNKIAKEIINETITAGLSLILVFSGINYFALKYAWFNIVSFFVGIFGAGGEAIKQELSLMGNEIMHTFPFRYVLNVDGFNFIYIGIVLTLIGLLLKIITTNTKGELIKDLGRNLKVPGIIGLVTAVTVQIISVITITMQASGEILDLNQLADFSVWTKFSFVFLSGFIALLAGSLVYYIFKAPKVKKVSPDLFFYKFTILARASIKFGILSLGYYFLIRVIFLFKGTTISNYMYLLFMTETMPITIILICFACICIGKEIQLLGIALIKKQKQKNRKKLNEVIYI